MKEKSTLKDVANNYLTHPGINNGITLIALVITIVLNSSYLAMARMNRFEKI